MVCKRFQIERNPDDPDDTDGRALYRHRAERTLPKDWITRRKVRLLD